MSTAVKSMHGQEAPTFTSLEELVRQGADLHSLVIAPEVADEILQTWNTTLNRKIDRFMRNRFARDMLNGRWDAGTALIVGAFDGRIVLGDGQHRMGAQVDSKTSQIYLMRVYLDRDAFEKAVEAVDRGKSRTLRNDLTIFSSLPPELSNPVERVCNVARHFLTGSPASRESAWERRYFAENHLAHIRPLVALPEGAPDDAEVPTVRFGTGHLIVSLVLAKMKYPETTARLIDLMMSGANLAAGSIELALFKELPNMKSETKWKDQDREIGRLLRVVYDLQHRPGIASYKLPTASKQIAVGVADIAGEDVAEAWLKRQSRKPRSA